MYKKSAMGTPPYERVTLVAVILYAMYKGHFESRNITSFTEDSIGAQWILNGMKMPSYKTVERTINIDGRRATKCKPFATGILASGGQQLTITLYFHL